MPYVPPVVVAQARKMDLLTYLRNYEPDELVPFSRDTYCTRTHDSLKISNGKWFWFSRGIGGASALDYLIKVRGIPFTQAVEHIMGRAATQPPSFFMPKRPAPRVLLLPKASPSANRAVTYLTSRGIDPEIIDFCIRSGRLYESTPHHNVVFVGLDDAGKPRYANLRRIGTDYVGESNGSDKRYSFSIPSQGKIATLHLFESAIDLLSYATLEKRAGNDWRRDHLVSLAGVYESRNEVLPLALTHYLDEHPNIDRVILRLDNDGKDGYVPQVSDGTVTLVVPLVATGPLLGDRITVTPNFGDAASSPIQFRNYQKTFSLADNPVNVTGIEGEVIQTVRSYLVRFDFSLRSDRKDGTYPISLDIQAEDEQGRDDYISPNIM